MKEKDLKKRRLVIDDAENLIYFSTKFPEIFKYFNCDLETIQARLLDTNFFGFGLFANDTIVGTISAFISEEIFNKKVISATIFNIAILPKYTGSFYYLFAYFKAECKKRKVNNLAIGLQCDTDTSKIAKLYTRLGFKQRSIIYAMEF